MSEQCSASRDGYVTVNDVEVDENTGGARRFSCA
jgi:hypothetical protein